MQNVPPKGEELRAADDASEIRSLPFQSLFWGSSGARSVPQVQSLAARLQGKGGPPKSVVSEGATGQPSTPIAQRPSRSCGNSIVFPNALPRQICIFAWIQKSLKWRWYTSAGKSRGLGVTRRMQRDCLPAKRS